MGPQGGTECAAPSFSGRQSLRPVVGWPLLTLDLLKGGQTAPTLLACSCRGQWGSFLTARETIWNLGRWASFTLQQRQEMFQRPRPSDHDVSVHLGVQPLVDQTHTPRHLWVRGWSLQWVML